MLVNLIHAFPLVGLLICQCLASLSLKAQGAIDTAGMRQQVKREAELFLKAGFAEDYNTVIKHYHPEQIEALGGEKNLLQELKAGSRLKNKAGLSTIQISITLPEELLIEDDAIQCAFRYTLHLPKTNFSEAQPHQSTMIAVSEDRGKSWYFLDARDTPVDRLIMFFSFINPNLNLPVDPAVQAQRDALNWEIKPFISGKEILNFNRKEQRVTFSVTEALLSSREGLVSTQGKVLLKPEFMSVEDRDSLIIVYSEDDIDGAVFKPGYWDQLLPLPDDIEDIYQLKNRQEESELSGLSYIESGENQFRIQTRAGKMIIQLEADQAPHFTKKYILYYKNNLNGLLNHQGKVLITPEKYANLRLYTDGPVVICAKLANTENYLLIDTLGNPIGKNESFSSIEQYPGLPYFTISKEVNGESKYGLMDQSGKIIIQPNYDFPIKMNSATYALPKGEKWELKSIKDHQPLLAGQSFDDIEFAGDYFIVNHYDKETIEVYSNDEKKQLNLDFDDIVLNSEVMIMNGKEVLFLGTMQGKLGYYLDGNPLLPDAVFKDINPAGLIFIQNGKMGLINMEGKILVPAALDEIEYLDESQSLWGKTNGKWGLLKL